MRTIVFTLLCLIGYRALQAQAPWATIATLAGNGTPGNLNGSCFPLHPQVNNPFGMAQGRTFDQIYIADQGNHQIRLMTYTGTSCSMSLVAGDTIPGYLDTVAAYARFNGPTNVCVDTFGNVYVSDFNNHRIRKISVGGMVTTLAGSGISGYQDGSADSARFCYPRGIAVDDSGYVYVADSWNHRIRKIYPSGWVTTLAGGGSNSGVGSVGSWADGPDTLARFYTPSGLFYLKQSAALFVADAYNHRIRRIDPGGKVTTVMGSGSSGPSAGGYSDGPDTLARLNTPTELTGFWSNEANDTVLFVSDSYNHGIRGMGLYQKQVFTEAGVAGPGFADGNRPGQFNFPRGLVVIQPQSGPYWLVVADFSNHRIRLIQDVWSGRAPDTETLTGFLYPNPGRNLVQFRHSLHTIRFMDATGRVCISQESDSGLDYLDLSGLPSGLYWVQGITVSGESVSSRFLLHSQGE